MIRGRYRTDGARHYLELTGHAEYANNGNDIVCAGASSLVYALLGWMENNEEDLEWADCDEKSGKVVIHCEGGERTAVVFEMVVIGLEQMAESYPDHVSIEITGIAG